MNPFAGLGGNYALCAENNAEFFLVAKLGQRGFKSAFGKLFAGFDAPARKNFVGMVMPVSVVVIMSATALAVLVFMMVLVHIGRCRPYNAMT